MEQIKSLFHTWHRGCGTELSGLSDTGGRVESIATGRILGTDCRLAGTIGTSPARPRLNASFETNSSKDTSFRSTLSRHGPTGREGVLVQPTKVWQNGNFFLHMIKLACRRNFVLLLPPDSRHWILPKRIPQFFRLESLRS